MNIGDSMQELEWWQKAVFYQIYPRSFADGNGDGIGDFHGMIDRLDYLRDLGVDALWLSPHYPSPIFDCGYDIAGYTAVAPEYGTLDDFERFLEGAHRRSIRVILDLVLNHTSDQHPWFIESRSSRDNPRRDWYIWRDGKNGGPPNNWYSGFGDSAWEHDPITGQYYYHYFFKQQPDLNWRNPKVRQTMWDVVRFWLNLGVDGFRLDAIGTIFEHPDLPDQSTGTALPDLRRALLVAGSKEEMERLAEQQKAMFQYQVEQPGMHELMQELRAVVDEYPDRVLVGETSEISYYGDGTNELHMAFNFPLMRTEKITPAWVRANQQERLSALPTGAWPCNTLGNHDASRIYSHYGDGQNGNPLARLHLALVLTLRGTPFLYNGEEIGMTDFSVEDVSQFRDNLSVWMYHTLVDEMGQSPEEALALAVRLGRDKCRTPMQWANAPNGGFSPAGVQTWLPVNHNYVQGINVAEQLGDPDSLLSFYQRLLHVRKQAPALVAGDYTPLHEDAEDYFAFLRHSPSLSSPSMEETEQENGQTCLVVLNMSEHTHTLRFDLDASTTRLIFSSQTRDGGTDDLSQLAIAPFEVYIGEIV
ncbi:MAG: alpha-glucosidase [Chloroflexota bacterium]|nr:alpha-glucosidase [Chloroflexota bacterium]